MIDEKELGAYVDGELNPSQVRAFEARMTADPGLAAEVERHRALRAQLSLAFDPVLAAEVPERLVAAVARPPAPRAARWSPLQWGAMAACLAVGVLAGRGIVDQGPFQTGAEGGLTARGPMRLALDSQLAADQAGKPVQVGLSFKSAQGDYCRTFESARDRLAGVACRQDGRWVAQLATAYQPAPASAAYRTAASSTPPQVLAAVDAMIAGEPLDAQGERAARARGWQD